MAGTTKGPDVWTGEAAASRTVDRLPVGLLTLWLATAILLVVAPFLTSYTTTTRLDGVEHHAVGVDGWGRMDDVIPGVHETRFGVLLALAAALLVLAGGALAVARWSRWPAQLGLVASGMAVAAGILQVLQIEMAQAVEDSEDALTVDVSIGVGTWLTWLAATMAAVAAVLSWRHAQARRGQTPGADRTAGRIVDGPPFVLLGLWLVMTAVLNLAPNLASATVTITDDNGVYTSTIDGWGRMDADGSDGQGFRLGVLCVVIAAALVIVLVGTLVRRAATWPIQLGLLVAAMTVAVGVFQLLGSDAILSVEASEEYDVSVGIGAWLLAGVGALSVVAVGLAMVRLRRRTS